MSNYWVVGATWGSDNDQTETFLRRGYWQLGYDDEDAPDQAARRDQIQAEDRIAIKRMLGQGSSDVEIRALGIVKEIDHSDKRVYVDWILTNLNRIVPSKGCYKSVHGPFPTDDAWTNEVFRL
jgi:hypothetical protein